MNIAGNRLILGRVGRVAPTDLQTYCELSPTTGTPTSS